MNPTNHKAKSRPILGPSSVKLSLFVIRNRKDNKHDWMDMGLKQCNQKSDHFHCSCAVEFWDLRRSRNLAINIRGSRGEFTCKSRDTVRCSFELACLGGQPISTVVTSGREMQTLSKVIIWNVFYRSGYLQFCNINLRAANITRKYPLSVLFSLYSFV